ncbi:MAG: hypothetical protein J5486_09330 [Bacteroidaceae bacterium]|nr:hypothetical protein [Bacteroidaceae bacterium]
MKLRTLLVAFATIVGLGVNAQTAADFANGKYVFYNVGSGRYLGPGNSWGTQASLIEFSHYNTLAKLSDGVYTIESQVSNGGTSYYFTGSFLDGAASNVTINDIGNGLYTMSNGTTYYGYSGNSYILASNLTDPSNENALWRITAYDEVYANASTINPTDVSYMILDANFDRNNRNTSAWTMVADNKNLSGGNDTNRCAESWRSAFTLSQTIDVPNGTYKLRAQAALTEYTVTGADMPVVYATSGTTTVSTPFKIMQNGENSMNTMSTQFTNGNYFTDYTEEIVVTNGSITIGVMGTRTDTWCIWDNFQLLYYGNGTDLSYLRSDLQAQIDAVSALEGKITTAAYNDVYNFANGIDVNSLDTESLIEEASKELASHVNAAKTLQSAYAGYVALRNKVDALDDDRTKFSGDGSIDISSIDATVQATTTLSELNSAIDNAISEFRSITSTFITSVILNEGERFDITDIYLTNADFEVSTPNGQLPQGWTITITGQNCGQQNRTDTNPTTGLAITNFIEAWHSSQLGNGVIAQTVSSLPEGTYILECDASICHDPEGADDIIGANLFVQSSLNKKTQAISNVRLYIDHYAVEFSHGGIGSVTFGLEAENTNANWLSADNFKVYYAGSVDLTIYKNSLADAVAEFEALEATADTTDYASYKQIVDANNKTWSNSTDYQTAITNVQNATSTLNALTTAKGKYRTALALAQSYQDQTMFEAPKTALNNAISENTLESGTSATYQTAADNLNAAAAAASIAVSQYVMYYEVVTEVEGKTNVDLTSFVTNADFEQGDLTSWTSIDGGNVSDNKNFVLYAGTYFAERWKNGVALGEGSLAHDAIILPAGIYRITADAQNIEQYNSGVFGTGLFLCANDERVEIGGGNNYQLTITLEDKDALTISFVQDNCTGNWICYDNITLTYIAANEAELEKIGLLSAIRSAEAINDGVNVGTGAFQIPTSAYESLTAVIETAQGVYDSESATSQDIQDAIATLTEAVTTYRNVELNAPADGQRFYIMEPTEGHTKQGCATVASLGSTGANNPTGYSFGANAGPAQYLAQAFIFTPVNDTETANLYYISIERPEGIVYLTNGTLNGSAASWADSQIQGTTDASKKMAFRVAVTEEEGIWNLYNTATNSTIAIQANANGSLYTETGNAAMSFVEARKASVSINTTAAKWGTMILPFAVTELPEGVKAYSCTEVNENGISLELTEVNALVPNKPYIINGSWNVTLTGWGVANKTTYTDGLLTGVYTATDAPVGSYVLQNNDGTVGFYVVAFEQQPKVGANRAYLTVPAESAGIKAFVLEDLTTRIQSVSEGLTHGDIYDLSGRKVSKMQHGGIYLINGQKVMVK